MKKKVKYETIDVRLPLDVIDFFKRVADHTNLTLNKVLNVVTTIEALKVLDAAKAQKKAAKKK
jgi:hypothetical protein